MCKSIEPETGLKCLSILPHHIHWSCDGKIPRARVIWIDDEKEIHSSGDLFPTLREMDREHPRFRRDFTGKLY